MHHKMTYALHMPQDYQEHDRRIYDQTLYFSTYLCMFYLTDKEDVNMVKSQKSHT